MRELGENFIKLAFSEVHAKYPKHPTYTVRERYKDVSV